MNYFKPWISDEEPKLPDGFGLAAIKNSNTYFGCQACGKKIEWQEQYLYSFQPNGTPCLHNTKECWDKYYASLIS